MSVKDAFKNIFIIRTKNIFRALIIHVTAVRSKIAETPKPSDRNLPLKLYSLIFVITHKAWEKVWARTHKYRPLLHKKAGAVRPVEKIKKWTLLRVLGLMDPYYKHHFKRLDNCLSLNPGNRVSDKSVMLSIGTLGPGGAERQLCLTAFGLKKHGINNLNVLCNTLHSDDQCFYKPFLENECCIDVKSLCTDLAETNFSDNEQYLQALQRLPNSLDHIVYNFQDILKIKPQVAHFWMDASNINGGIAAVAAGVPRIVLGMRSLAPINFPLHLSYMREGYRWLAKHPNVVMINNSAAGARSYENWLGLPPGSIGVVHNAINLNDDEVASFRKSGLLFRKELGISDNSPLMGTVIRLTEEKRPLLWIDVAAQIKQKMPDAKFLMIGDGIMREELKARVSEADLDGSIYLLPNSKNVFQAMAAMDLFFLSSRAEGLPNVLLEAQRLGVPVVTTNVGGASETLIHGTTGWVLEKDDPDYISDTIVNLMKNKEFISMAGDEARLFAKRSFSLDKMIKDTMAVYNL